MRNNNYIYKKRIDLFCPDCGHKLVIAEFLDENYKEEVLYCEKCDKEIYEEDIYETERERDYQNCNRRKSLESLL